MAKYLAIYQVILCFTVYMFAVKRIHVGRNTLYEVKPIAQNIRIAVSLYAIVINP